MDKVSVVKNIFKEQERKYYLKIIEPLMSISAELKFHYGGEKYPGKQTHPTLHMHPHFKSFMDRILEIASKDVGVNLEIDRAWGNWTNGNSNDIGWHRHYCDYALVYYLKTSFLNNGTLFKKYGLIQAPQNSIIIFPAHLMHTAPTFWYNNPFGRSRYTIAMNLNKSEGK